MHLRMIFAMARKDALDIWLDKSKLGALLGPLVLGLLWLFITHLGGSGQPAPTMLLVYNPGQSSLPQVVSSVLPAAQITQATSPAQVSAAFAPNSAHSYDVGLIIPADFEQQLKAGGQPQVTLYLNGTNLDATQRGTLQGTVLYYARTVVTPNAPVNLVTQAINTTTKTTPTPSVAAIYGILLLPISLIVGLILLPGLVIEEKEKKTLRWLLVSPASLSDILLGKLLVVLIYQLLVSIAAMALLGSFEGNIPLLLLYILLGACLSLALGLFFGVLFQTTSAANVVGGICVFLFVIPTVIVALAPFIPSSPITNLMKALPPYYVAEGADNAIQKMGSFSGNLLDVGVILATTLVVFMITIWALRRQAFVAGAI